MTPRRLDYSTVQSRPRLLEDLIVDLRDVGQVTVARLERERFTRHIVERILTQLVDIANSINTHIVAAELDRAPDSYRESFKELARAHVISFDFADELGPSAGMRNALIHDYLDIDVEKVASAVPMAIEQYGRYVEEVARWLLERQKVSGGM